MRNEAKRRYLTFWSILQVPYTPRPPSASAEKNGSSTSGSSGGGGGGEGWYNLQLIERVNALFDGDSLRKFQARSAPHCEAPSAHRVTPEASR